MVKGGTRLVCAATLVATYIGAAEATPLIVAEGGKARASIVLAAEPTADERAAAELLQSYLGKVTAATFTICAEAEFRGGPALWVGPTARARRACVVADKLAAEQWLCRRADDGLLLVGGRPRGTYYAVATFLESDCGVHWWTPWEEEVPARPQLTVGDVKREGRPCFALRDVYHTCLPGDLPRSNGDTYVLANKRCGGTSAYRPFGAALDWAQPGVHTTFFYLSPDKYGTAHPD